MKKQRSQLLTQSTSFKKIFSADNRTAPLLNKVQVRAYRKKQAPHTYNIVYCEKKDDLMYCRKCGNQIPDGSEFCTQCRADLMKVAAKKQFNNKLRTITTSNYDDCDGVDESIKITPSVIPYI